VLPDGTPSLVVQVDGPHLLGLTSRVGRPLPLHASSSGKMVLAHASPARVEAILRMPLEKLASHTITGSDPLRAQLTAIREQGWSSIEDELEDGVSSVSMGIVVDGAPFGTVNVSGPTVRFDAAARTASLPHLRAACGTIASRLT
jgi:DNA-binding IclR family transcriptional regulator